MTHSAKPDKSCTFRIALNSCWSSVTFCQAIASIFTASLGKKKMIDNSLQQIALLILDAIIIPCPLSVYFIAAGCVLIREIPCLVLMLFQNF